MYRKEVNAQSPLRILEKSIHGGLGKGHLGVVMAPAGVGKTACLVQIGLDDLMREKDVLHVAIGYTVEQVSAWYDALFDDLAASTKLDDRDSVRASLQRHSVIKAFNKGAFTPARLEEALELFGKHMQFQPAAILVDGLDWSAPGITSTVESLKAIAKRLGAELWLTAQTPRGAGAAGRRPSELLPPCDGCAALVDVALFLEPQGSHVAVRLVKDHGDAVPPAMQLELHSETLALMGDVNRGRSVAALPASSYTLLSGGAAGAEAEFGSCAERWGLPEVNFSFPGRGAVRSRGLVTLDDEELKQGDVSGAYLRAHMHRSYPDTPLFKKVLQSIWHQVNTSGEVFSVGQINADKTVTGGTGWAVELAKHWGKPVHVFDQEKRAWFIWNGEDWAKEADPRVTRERFTGTGTRFLSDDGKAAINALFERSFGPAQA